jgi:signal transduction histidine kinase
MRMADDPTRSDVGGGPGGAGVRGRAGRTGSIIAVVLWATVLLRVFGEGIPADHIPWYVGGLLIFLAIQLIVLGRSGLSIGVLFVGFSVQAAIVLVLVSLHSEQDWLTTLLVVEAYEAAVLLGGRARLVWVGVLLALIPVSLVFGALGVVEGLALAFVPMAGGLVVAMFAVESQDLETSRAESERMVADLREARHKLEAYAGQVEELAAIEERSRVAQALEASVSTTLDDALAAARAAREARGAPQEASALLERLQALTQEALAQMRRVIAELRPPVDAKAGPADPR